MRVSRGRARLGRNGRPLSGEHCGYRMRDVPADDDGLTGRRKRSRMKTVLILDHDGMGHGDPQLGQRILATFLRKSPALQKLRAVVLFNSGVKLVIEGSPVLTELRQLHDNGVDICPCGTCLEFFGLTSKLAVGEVSNMDAIIAELDQAEKVISL